MTETFEHIPEQDAERPLWPAIKKGLVGRCPACGEGWVFKSFLELEDYCPHCNEELFHHRADDGPPFFSMFFVAPFVAAVMIFYELASQPPVRHHLVIGIVLGLLLCVVAMPPIKALFLAIQWAKRMHGFGTSKTADQ